MTEYVMRFLSMLVARLLAQAERLARLAAVRHEVTQYAAAYEEATALEASGRPELAKLLRAELDQTIGSALTAGPTPQPALNEGGNGRPFAAGATLTTGATFALEPPRPQDAVPSADQPPSPPEGEGPTSTPAARRRPRRPKKAKAPEQQAPSPPAAGLFDPPTTTTTPVSNPNQS